MTWYLVLGTWDEEEDENEEIPDRKFTQRGYTHRLQEKRVRRKAF